MRLRYYAEDQVGGRREIPASRLAAYLKLAARMNGMTVPQLHQALAGGAGIHLSLSTGHLKMWAEPPRQVTP